ncbi:MAG: TraR/DksA C4-type zinc finger protein [Bacteroidetes bacterium]|nr:TraR/DksA C4-type zinc finger protein [Bacteroidota bacterium]MCH8524555.1 TraR/DksA C4-type zinc finger protein [Balneolales bacterium]
MLTDADRSKLTDILEAHIAEAATDIAGLEEATRPVAPENSIGRISRMDAIHNKSVAEVSLRETKNRLKRLNTALSKIDSPSFGKCIRCGEDIPMGRLEFMPHTTRCVQCM